MAYIALVASCALGQQRGCLNWTNPSICNAYCSLDHFVYNKCNESHTWNMSAVTKTPEMFALAPSFNGDISKWDMQKVNDMMAMFTGATLFNSNISAWNTENVEDMTSMFDSAISFNQDVSGWDVSKVVFMRNMFYNTTFNKNISKWNVSGVIDMSGMFEHTSKFNQDISKWDVANVFSTEYMFAHATSFNQDISGWTIGVNRDPSSINTLGMFNNATAFLNHEGGCRHYKTAMAFNASTHGLFCAQNSECNTSYFACGSCDVCTHAHTEKK